MNEYIELLLGTDAGFSHLLLRITAGLVIWAHGAQKLLGWYGGYGFKGTMGYFTQTVNLPAVVALAIIVIESIGSLLLVAGLGTRIWAAGIAGVMLGAIWIAHRPQGFFMNWYGAKQGEGYEFHLLVLGILAVLIMDGGGSYSVDALLTR